MKYLSRDQKLCWSDAVQPKCTRRVKSQGRKEAMWCRLLLCTGFSRYRASSRCPLSRESFRAKQQRADSHPESCCAQQHTALKHLFREYWFNSLMCAQTSALLNYIYTHVCWILCNGLTCFCESLWERRTVWNNKQTSLLLGDNFV